MEDIVVALVRRAHGLTGELQLLSRTDHPDDVFVAGREFGVLGGASGMPRRLTLTELRPHGKQLLARFAGIEHRTLAERLTGVHLTVPRDTLPALEENEFFVHDLVGFEVVCQDGTEVGSVGCVYDASGQILLGVEGADGEKLIPFSSRVVAEVQTEARRMIIHPLPGLLE